MMRTYSDTGNKASASVTSDISLRSIDLTIETALTENYDAFRQYLMRRVGDACAVDDVLQNFCVRVVRSRTVLRNKKAVMGWLYTVLRSVLIDHYRAVASRGRMEASYLQERVALDEEYDHIGHEENNCKCIDNLVPKLRPDYAQVLRRVDLSDEPREDVAIDLGISSTNVRVRLHRARHALRKAMIACCGTCCETSFDDCTCAEDCG